MTIYCVNFIDVVFYYYCTIVRNQTILKLTNNIKILQLWKIITIFFKRDRKEEGKHYHFAFNKIIVDVSVFLECSVICPLVAPYVEKYETVRVYG